jgi:hypothetical protein
MQVGAKNLKTQVYGLVNGTTFGGEIRNSDSNYFIFHCDF